MSNESIQLKKNGQIAYLRLNRPEVFNSFNREMALSFQKHLEECASNDDVRVVVIVGNGKAFCAGQDLKEVTDPSANPGFKRILEEHYNPIVRQIRDINKPVVAAVNGVAAGAGANIALACDIVVADAQASFIQAFSKIGLVPDSGGTFFLPRLIGFQRASALAMLGDKVSSAEALEMGMIYKVFDSDSFEAEVEKLADKLAKMPTKALGMIKQLLNASLTNNLNTQLNMESACQIEAAGSEDYAEGVSAFIEKRKPVFKGR